MYPRNGSARVARRGRLCVNDSARAAGCPCLARRVRLGACGSAHMWLGAGGSARDARFGLLGLGRSVRDVQI